MVHLTATLNLETVTLPPCRVYKAVGVMLSCQHERLALELVTSNYQNMNEKEHTILSSLVAKGIIPTSGLFQIKEHQLSAYIGEYHRIFGETSKATGSKTNKKFARRLAGRTLLRENALRGAKFSEIDAGIVYLIENKSFPEHYKVGMTLDLKKRLSQYQTYTPYRDFTVYKYDFVLDRKKIEKAILSHPDIANEAGEWVLKHNAAKIFETIVNSGVAQR